jgi:hypothetical protein
MSDSPEVSGPSETLDAKVLLLRSEGRAFARISRELQLHRSLDAQKAFMRALRRLPNSDADRVRVEEISRLDRLADHVRTDTRRNDMDRARQLKAIERMRTEVNDKG